MSISSIGNNSLSYSAMEANSTGSSKSYLKELQKKHSTLNLMSGTRPPSSRGFSSLTISPNILREMKSDPKAAEKYDKLIGEVAEADKHVQEVFDKYATKGSTLLGHGWIIDSNGDLHSWTVGRSEDTRHKNKNGTSYNEKKIKDPKDINETKLWHEKLMESLTISEISIQVDKFNKNGVNVKA